MAMTSAGQLVAGDPSGEAALKGLRVERGEVAQMIVRWRAVREWQEASQQRELGLPGTDDLREALGPGESPPAGRQ